MKVTVDGWYWFRFDEMAASHADALRRKLTISSVSGKRAISNRLYAETAEQMGIPRSFFRDSVTQEHDISFVASKGAQWPNRIPAPVDALWAKSQIGDDDELTIIDPLTGDEPDGFLTDSQAHGVSLIMAHLCTALVGDAIADFPSNETAIRACLRLIRLIKVRVLVLATPGVVNAAWLDCLAKYIPDALVSTIDHEGRHFSSDSSTEAHVTVAAMGDAKSWISNGTVDDEEFGLIISHQINKMDPIEWSQVALSFKAAKRLGIADSGAQLDSGLSRVFKYHMGDSIFSAKPDLGTPKVKRVWSEWKISSWVRVNPQFVSKENLLDHLCISTEYNEITSNQIIAAIVANRKVMVVSDKLAHLQVLHSAVSLAFAGGDKVMDYAIDGMPPEDVLLATKADVVFTTFSFIRNMPEMPGLDTVILASPVSDPIPAVMLCLTKGVSKKDPIIVDMRCDSIPICKDYGKSRDRAYQRLLGDG